MNRLPPATPPSGQWAAMTARFISTPQQTGYGQAEGTLATLPPEVRASIFEVVFLEGQTTVYLTAFCDLSSDRIDVMRLRSDDHASTLDTLSDLANYQSFKPHAIGGPLAVEATAAFWKNAKIVINIQDEVFRSPIQEPFHPANGFLAQAAGKLSHFEIKLWLLHPADAQALAHQVGSAFIWTSCAQTFAIKSFATGAQAGRVPRLSVAASQHLGGFSKAAPTTDLIYRRQWCDLFLVSAGVGTTSMTIYESALTVLLLRVSAFNTNYTTGTIVTVPPNIVQAWQGMTAAVAGQAVRAGTLITPAGTAFASTLPAAAMTTVPSPQAIALPPTTQGPLGLRTKHSSRTGKTSTMAESTASTAAAGYRGGGPPTPHRAGSKEIVRGELAEDEGIDHRLPTEEDVDRGAERMSTTKNDAADGREYSY